jgi:hypothetical protein
VKKRISLSANQLKIIAIAAMLTDHIGWAFVSSDTPIAEFAVHFIGRLTAPLMCFFIAEGFYHTRNVKKYALRLLGLSVISHVPYVLFVILSNGQELPLSVKDYFIYGTSSMMTYFLGLLALMVWHDEIMLKFTKIAVIAVLGFFCLFCDWGYITFLWILSFGLLRHKGFKYQIAAFAVVAAGYVISDGMATVYALYPVGVFGVIPLLLMYNGERGRRGQSSKLSKWFFYALYPAHLLILDLILILA